MTYLRNTILLSVGMIGALMAFVAVICLGDCPEQYQWTLYTLMIIGIGTFALSISEVGRG